MYKADENRYNNLITRHAGKSGLVLPPISLGLWRHYGSKDPLLPRRDVILHAFDRGIFHFDVANHYGNDTGDWGSTENLLGHVLKTELKPYRDELVISTKAGYEIHDGPFGVGTSRKALFQSIDGSLNRLQLDYVDIYYAHRFDDQTPIEETVRALDDIVRQGKALYIGISNYETPQAKKAIQLFKDLGTPFVLDQMSYNILNRDVETSGLIDTLGAEGAGLIAYGPLAEGLLSDRYLGGIPDDFPIHRTNSNLLLDGTEKLVTQLNELNQLAQKRGQTLSQFALAWLLKDPVVTSVIIGTTSIEHLDENLKTLEHLDLTKDELAEIDQILK
ncbi:aldo/keto reductase [Pediococcus stilesii]|uniref:Aldo keto reductase n=1 Tax=Pediococcus stilesii TaxID=331679 RepID=A0A0R2KUR7_9LACO|nr:aldo/keto reductase [Pediococcus stilesii]KRN93230.1 aldo keto reductase [Pediococcus stilesii]